MYRLLLILLVLFSNTAIFAQYSSETTPTTTDKSTTTMSRNIFGEILGPSFGLGVNFDSRFRPGTPFGYRVGLSWTDGSDSDSYDYWREVKFHGLCVPLEINAIFGQRRSKFEIGVGATPSLLYRKDTKDYRLEDRPSGYSQTTGTKLNILGTINIGYRYQREEGFFMRVGVTAYIGDFDCSPIDGIVVLPGLGLGYTFKY